MTGYSKFIKQYSYSHKHSLSLFASVMALSLVVTTAAWTAPATLGDAVTLSEVRQDGKVAAQNNPQDQLDKYEYEVNGTTVKPNGNASSFTYEYNGTTTNLGDKPILDGTDYTMTGANGKNYNAAGNIPQTDYTYEKSGAIVDITTSVTASDYEYIDHSGQTQNITNKPNVTKYEYKDSAGNTHSLQLNQNGVLVVPDGVEEDPVAMANASLALSNYAKDAGAYNEVAAQYNKDLIAFNEAVNDYTNDNETLKGLKDQYAADDEGFKKALEKKGEYGQDAALYATYNGTLSQIIDNKAEAIAKQTVSDAINGELEGLDGIVGKVETNADNISKNAENIATNAENISKNAENIAINAENISKNTDNIAINADNISKNTDNIAINADNISKNAENIAINAENISKNAENIAINAENISKNAENIATNTNSINTLNGDVDTIGSVQHTIYNNAQNAIFTGTQVVSDTETKVASVSTTEPTTLGSALTATNVQVNKNTVNIASNLVKIEQNRSDISQLRTDFEAQNVRNEARFSNVEKKIEEVNDEMHKGLASTAALTSLVPLSSRHRTQLSLGMGGYRDKQAVAAGGYHYLAGNVLLNAGIAWGGDDSVSYKAGVTYGF